MPSNITAAEDKLNDLLPVTRLQHSPPGELLAAAIAWSDAVWDEALRLGSIALNDEQLTQGINLAKNPLFIFGVHRSGTTLVRDILDGHPKLVVLPSEGTYFTNLEVKLLTLTEDERVSFLGKEWLRRLANPINQPPYWLLGRSTDNTSPYVDFARYLLAWWAMFKQDEHTQWPHAAIVLAYASCTNNLSAKLWVDKTPANERHLKRIWHEMPEAKIIHIVRDPVATMASRKKMEPGISLRNALRDLKMSYQTAIKHTNDPRFMLVRYEELCENPQLITGQIVAFLNIAQAATLNQTTVAGMPAQANSSFSREAVLGKILRPEQHQQTGALTTKEQQLMAAVIGPLANKLGYPVAKVGAFRTLYLKLFNRLL